MLVLEVSLLLNELFMTVEPPESIYVSHTEMESVFHKILLQHGLSDSKAKICAQVFTSNSVDGVYSHGVNRFYKYIQLLKKGLINVNAEPMCVQSGSALEQWDGAHGLGVTNAFACTDRAMELADSFGMGCVAIANTNHWLRGGTYAWHATRKGYAFIGWSNTIANTPAWGAVDARLGNNPLVIGMPYEDQAIVLDMAMSQFSYGALDNYNKKGEKLPVAGGYDSNGELSTDPSEILRSRRTLPIGYWKGSGLSLLLDIMAAILSGGLSVQAISKQKEEVNLSQVFIVFDLKRLHNFPSLEIQLNNIIEDLKQSAPDETGSLPRYPGEGVLQRRDKNLANGIPVLKVVWEEILTLL
jgi:3-dehydro-L-gulonate 2-dehydrogenase